MARYLELAEQAMREIRARRKLEKNAGGRKFSCHHCGAHFDTDVGIAKHQANGCGPQCNATPQSARDLPSCPSCGSHALYREKFGAITCQTCHARRESRQA